MPPLTPPSREDAGLVPLTDDCANRAALKQVLRRATDQFGLADVELVQVVVGPLTVHDLRPAPAERTETTQPLAPVALTSLCPPDALARAVRLCLIDVSLDLRNHPPVCGAEV